MLELNLFFHALALLCGLGSVVFATIEGPTRRGCLTMALGLAAAAAFVTPGRLADPAGVGVVAASLAVAALVRPRAAIVAAVGSGALAGVWGRMLETAGMPWPVAFALAVAAPAATLFLMRRQPDFAPAALREEALLVIMALALVVAVAPGIAAGWQSAAILNVQQTATAAAPVPAWALLVTLGATTLGGLYTIWMRR